MTLTDSDASPGRPQSPPWPDAVPIVVSLFGLMVAVALVSEIRSGPGKSADGGVLVAICVALVGTSALSAIVSAHRRRVDAARAAASEAARLGLAADLLRSAQATAAPDGRRSVAGVEVTINDETITGEVTFVENPPPPKEGKEATGNQPSGQSERGTPATPATPATTDEAAAPTEAD